MSKMFSGMSEEQGVKFCTTPLRLISFVIATIVVLVPSSSYLNYASAQVNSNSTTTITPEQHDCIKHVIIGAGLFGIGTGDKDTSVAAYVKAIEKCIISPPPLGP